MWRRVLEVRECAEVWRSHIRLLHDNSEYTDLCVVGVERERWCVRMYAEVRWGGKYVCCGAEGWGG